MTFDPMAKPLTLTIIRRSAADQLTRLEIGWPIGAGVRRSYGGDDFGYDSKLKALLYYDEDEDLWLHPLEAGAPVNLGRSYPYASTSDKVLYVDKQDYFLFVYSLPLRAHVALNLRLDPLGSHGDLFLGSSWFVWCGSEGLRSVSLEPVDGRITVRDLDAQPCDGLRGVTEHQVRYAVRFPQIPQYKNFGQQVDYGLAQYTVLLDGSEPPLAVVDLAPLAENPWELARCKNGLRAYSMNLRRSGAKGGDGWVNGWRFSDEPDDVAFSYDCRRIRWKEHRDSAGIGEIFSAEIGSSTRLRLARNAATFAELLDGRVLTQSNLIGLPAEARLLLLDEDARRAHWLLDGSAQVTGAKLIPGINELVLKAHEGPEPIGSDSGRTVVRLPVPPRPSSPAR